MPRKKAAAAVDPAWPAATHTIPILPAAIACPACKSKISADGKTLHEKSGYLEELVETDAGVDEIEKSISARNAERAALQTKVSERDATIADLRAQLAASLSGKGRVDLAPAKNEKETTRELVQGKDGKPKSKSWWD
jgi:hypothetical protein